MTPADPKGAPPSRGRALLLAIAICLAGIVAYLPSLPGEFIWDDDAHVTHNPVLRDVAGLVDIWVPQFEPEYVPHTPQYYPLAFTALWLEFQAFGVEPLGYHLVNLALHLANALLIWALFARLRAPGAWLLGALFALHPMHVETAAWAMEVKNLLSALFYLLAALAYLRFDERREAQGRFPWGGYALVTALFLGSLLSKSISCTLPAALVLALAFQRERLTPRRLAPLAPLLVLGVALALNTAWLEHNHVGAKGEAFVYGGAERALIASRVMLFYPWKLLVPYPNLFVYPRWEIEPSQPLAWWPVALVLAIGALALASYLRGRRGPALALAFFAGSVLPASGVVTYYPMMFSFVADHFCYLPSVGILALVAAAVQRVGDAKVRTIVSAALLAGLGALTMLRSSQYATAEALYRHTIAHNPDAWMARVQLAQLLLPGGQPWKKGASMEPDPAKLREAEAELRAAIALKEDYEILHYDLALALLHQGRPAEGLPSARRAVELRPGDPEMVGVAAMLAQLSGQPEVAEGYARRALELDPSSYKALQVLGDVALGRGRDAQAREHFAQALAVAPNATARAATSAQTTAALARTTPVEALAFLDELERRLGGLPPELQRLRAPALAAAGRLDEALQLTEALIADATRRGARDELATLERQLELLRRMAAEAR